MQVQQGLRLLPARRGHGWLGVAGAVGAATKVLSMANPSVSASNWATNRQRSRHLCNHVTGRFTRQGLVWEWYTRIASRVWMVSQHNGGSSSGASSLLHGMIWPPLVHSGRNRRVSENRSWPTVCDLAGVPLLFSSDLAIPSGYS